MNERFEVNLNSCPDDLERVNGLDLTIEEFVQKYELPRRPVVLTDLQNEWQAKEKWTLDVKIDTKPVKIMFYVLNRNFFSVYQKNIVIKSLNAAKTTTDIR